MSRVNAFTPEEDRFITEQFGILSIAEMAQVLGRKPHSIRNRRYNIGVSGSKKFRWTPAAEQMVKDVYAKRNGHFMGHKELADRLGCAQITLARKARELGLADIHANARDESGRYRRNYKFANAEERRAHLSRVRKEWHQTHDHPRGALGMKHSEETRKRISDRVKEGWGRMSPEQREAAYDKAVETKIERYGSAGPVNITNPYSRTNHGYVDDLPGIFFRSGWEANYARYLDWLKGQGEIQSWEYEAETFIFHGVTRAPVNYTPDFRVTERDGSVVYHEVKGWMDGKSKSKLKRMKKFHPQVSIIVVDEGAYRAIAKWASVIPHWGEMPRTRKKGGEECE